MFWLVEEGKTEPTRHMLSSFRLSPNKKEPATSEIKAPKGFGPIFAILGVKSGQEPKHDRRRRSRNPRSHHHMGESWGHLEPC